MTILARRSAAALAMLVALHLTNAREAAATTMVLPSIESLADRADLIVRARPRPGSAVTDWDDDHRLIVTRTTLDVIETLAGDTTPPSEVIAETLGGFIASENIGMTVPGAPVLRDGEEVVLFLVTDSHGVRRPLDLAAGKFEVVGRGAQRTLTRRDLAGADTHGDPGTVPRTFDELRAAVAAVRRHPGKGR